jgi:DNA polymerase-3 subunit delta
MSSAALKALAAVEKSRAFAPAYYLHGDEEYLKEDAVTRLVDAVVDPATRDFNLESRRGPDLDAGALDALLGAMPMLAERRVIVLRDPSALKKGPRAVLDRYLERPAGDTLLLLVAPAGAKPDPVLLARAEAWRFDALSDDRVAKWIAHHAQAEHGVGITPEAVALLQGVVGNDLRQLAAELDKLASYAQGERAAGGEGAVIDDAAVSAVVGVRRGETLGDLLDAVARRDAGTALGLVPHVLAQPNASGVTTVMALTAQMLGIGVAQTLHARNVPAAGIEREMWNLLKSGGAFPGRPWGDAVKAWTASAGAWSADAVDRALGLLLDTDAALKETRVSSEEQVLATLVVALCALPGGARGRGSRAA